MTSPSLTKLYVSTYGDDLFDTNQVFIAYDGDIQKTRVTVDKFEFLESLNYLGSNLGLWPGLGLYQILEGVGAFVFSLSLGKILLKRCRMTIKYNDF